MNNPEDNIAVNKSKWAGRRKDIEPKAISLLEHDLVKTGFLTSGSTLPLVVEPNIEGVSLITWARSNLDFIEANLIKHGGILFRGFQMETQSDFEQFLDAISLDIMNYIEGATPRTRLSEKVYTSTEYPSELSIALHNELTYVLTWPRKICFFCVTPPEQGGETPIADVRKVLKQISHETLQPFSQKGWMLVRNFGDELSLPWQTSFHASSREEVESYCHNAQVECYWKDREHLRTQQVRPALAKHPDTGEMLWFNHVAFWHVSSLDAKVRQAMTSIFKEEDLPYNTYYGDGSPISDSIAEELREAYNRETVTFTWAKGDLLLLDNMLVAHGRNPFKGARKILAAMGTPYSNRGV